MARRSTLRNVELAEWTQHPVAVDIRPTLTKVVDRRQLKAGLATSETIRLAGSPRGVGHSSVEPGVRLPDPRRRARRRVGTLTTRPVALISGQAEHARSLADTRQPRCTPVSRNMQSKSRQQSRAVAGTTARCGTPVQKACT